MCGLKFWFLYFILNCFFSFTLNYGVILTTLRYSFISNTWNNNQIYIKINIYICIHNVEKLHQLSYIQDKMKIK